MQGRSNLPSDHFHTRLAHAAIIARLCEPARLVQAGPLGRETVMAVRILAVCSRIGKDPLPDLLHHLETVDRVRCFLAFADAVGTCWPDRVQVLRPCCALASPDEMTIAALVEAASMADRLAFSRQIEGLVRPDRQERLFDHAVRLAASLMRPARAGPSS